MGKKITISIQEDLHSKMEKWRGSFNFSRVFQEAIREKINRKEEFKRRLKEGGFDMEATVERLRGEMAEVNQDLFDQGKNNGFVWASMSHYLDIKSALGWNPEMGDLPDEEDLRAEVVDMIHEDPDLDFETDSWQMARETIEWAKGWVEGVQEFWNQVKDKL